MVRKTRSKFAPTTREKGKGARSFIDYLVQDPQKGHPRVLQQESPPPLWVK